MNSKILKVIIIDGNPQSYIDYKSYFEEYTDFTLNGVYASVDAALFEYETIQPDIIISEVQLPLVNGIEGLKRFRKIDANVKVIMTGQQSGIEVIKKAFKHGANGFLTKPFTSKRLYHALDSVKKEGAVIGNDVAKMIISTFRPKSYEAFSERENQIIDYLSQGATYKTIAEKLFVTASAVNFHIQNIYLKLNVNSKSEALLKLQEIG
ncbi:response regulator transcription factor [Aggregatimonas sangjinii]|uniref:Response regulator transcription factor n=1 Tax=Aggregatimonas sangjinii TaxID=2583587 RepID=A0A5B7SNI5_9FLAO|nr:response regulator transcription factor [Aggregatimonas sangjinii]QCX00126.1 response regulator transcription factor [Aggregatimonas sangjinii]